MISKTNKNKILNHRNLILTTCFTALLFNTQIQAQHSNIDTSKHKSQVKVNTTKSGAQNSEQSVLTDDTIIIEDPALYADRMKKLDPLEPLNRGVFALNTFMDRLFFQHMALAYRELVPQPAKNRVTDFLNNLSEPVVFLNDVLQGEFKQSMTSLTRFLLNSTFGILGLWDIAGKAGLKRKSNDFEATFKRWGIASGPYIVLPLLGPSSFRNTIGDVAEYLVDPYNWYMRNHKSYKFMGRKGGAQISVRAGAKAIVRRSEVLKITEKLDKTTDPYAQYRILYLQSRQIIDAIEESAVPDDMVSDD